MNDQQIRDGFHHKYLRKYQGDSKTIVIDELGLHHGRCRADIAVINGQLIGYEIKSDVDSLRRLDNQIASYDAVFDRTHIIATPRHLIDVTTMIPDWWGVISAGEGKRGAVHFRTIRNSKNNPGVSDYAIAQLLWRNEAQEILRNLGVHGQRLRERREYLYGYIVSDLNSAALRKTVRDYLMKRTNWRYPLPPVQGDGLCQPNATL